MKSLKLGFFFLAALGFQSASAQLEIFPKPYKNNNLWTVAGKLVDTLYVGASFTRTSFKPVTVSLKGNEAGWTGDLLFIDPKTGIEDRLFSNHDAPGTTVTLSDRHDIGIGDTVYFIYKVTTPSQNNYPSVNSRLPKYTGPNIQNVSKYWSQAVGGKYGRRWSVAGRLNDSLVIFGFEDNVEASSDFDYDDIVFLTTLSLANDEVPPHLTFVDKAGLPLAPGAFFSPANDTIWLVYTDDYNAGTDKVTFNVNVKNRRGAAAADLEAFTGVVPTRNGITGTWKIAIPLNEAPGIPGDKKLQVFWLGEITATVASHTRNQIPDGNTVSATLNVAYPDKPEVVDVRSCPDSTADITRITTCISVRVVDQNFTRNLDTVWAEMKCDLSGDIIAKVALIEQADGSYRSVDIVKNEDPANPGNQLLSCKSTDNITVTYTDEVYNKKVTDKAAWSGDAPEGLIFAPLGNNNTPLTTAKDGETNTFQVVAKGPSPTVGVKDTIQVTVTSAQGDVEIFTAVETEVNSNVYNVQMGFLFQTTPPASFNGKIEAFLDPTKVVQSVPLVGTAVINGKAYTANITLLPSLNLAKNAYIKDTDGDGRGDKVYIVFTRPLEALPTTVTPLYWNAFTPADSATSKPVISMGDQPNIVVADFTANQFPLGMAEIPVGVAPPIATLPSNNTFGGQKVNIADSIGPVVISAVIRPYNLLGVVPGTTDLNVDTLIIKVSEAMRTRTDWQDLIRVGAAKDGKCNDYANSVQVAPYGQPQLQDEKGKPNDTSYVILINKAPRVLTGECVYMNVNGTYTDLVQNLPPIHGVKVTGEAPPVAVRMQGFPPVAGLNANNPGFVMVNNDPRAGGTDGEFSKLNGTTYQTVWVPPADWPAGWVPNGTNNVYTPEGHLVNDAIQEGRDPSVPVQMPGDIGAVQVVATTPYIANVAIFDNLGHFVQKFNQSFGYRGEMSNSNRKVDKGMVSYLVWNLKDAKGRRVGNGVYIWKAVFNFKNGKQEIRYVRTGVTRAKGN